MEKINKYMFIHKLILPMLVGCGVCATEVTYSPEKKPNILDVLVLMLEKGYLSPDLKDHIQPCIERYRNNKRRWDNVHQKSRPLIEAFVKATYNFRKIRADTLSDENKDKITPEMRKKIINNKPFYKCWTTPYPSPDVSERNSPECVRLYGSAFRKLRFADEELRSFYSWIQFERSIRSGSPASPILNPKFLLDDIAIYDRFIKAKNELEKCLYTAQLAAASQGMRQTLAPESYPPSQT